MYYLDFRDLTPDQMTLERVHLAMSRIYAQAPYGSDCTCEISEVEASSQPASGVQVRIHVESADDEFEAIATGHDIKVMLRDAEDQIHQQLRAWRGHRFDEEGERPDGFRNAA